MAAIKKVDLSSFDEIYSLLTGSKWEKPKSTWRNLFDPKWETGESFCGYALVDNGKVVGFLSLIFSHRMNNGEPLKTCGLSAWFVENRYRSESLKLLEPVLQLNDYVLINLTASRTVYEISKALNFMDFEEDEVCILPRLALVDFLRYKGFIVVREKEITALLNDNDLLIYDDHKTYNYHHMVLQPAGENTDYCYLVFKRITRKRLPSIRVDYISNKEIFVKYIGQIIFEEFKKRPFVFLFVDSRLITPHHIFLSFKSKLKVPRFYRPDRNGSIPSNDNLYSEFALLDF